MLFAAGLSNGACPELWNDTHADVVRGHPRGLLRRRQRHRRDQHLRRHPTQAQRVRDRRPHARAEREGRAPGPRGGAGGGLRGRLHRAHEPAARSTTRSTTSSPTSEYDETFREQAEALAEGGVDLFAVETMMFPQEGDGGHPGVQGGDRSAGDGHHVLPVRGDATTGTGPCGARARPRWPRASLAAGADVVGMNCGRGPDRAIVIIREMRAVTEAPAGRLSERRPADHHGRHRRRTSWVRRRWRASIRRSSTPAATSWAPAAGRIPSTSAASPRSSEADARSGERRLSDGAPRPHRDLPLAIDPAEVLRFQGYKTAADAPDPDVRALFDEALALGRQPHGAARRRALGPGDAPERRRARGRRRAR